MLPDIESKIEEVIELIQKYKKSSRESSLTITKLEEALLWLTKTEFK